MPAASKTACSSAIPTSWNLSGIAFWRASRPVPLGIAAVIPTIFSLVFASLARQHPKTSWYLGGVFLLSTGDFPVLRSKGPEPCHFSGSSRATGKPLPFWVSKCSTIGSLDFFANSKNCTKPWMSCPSIGPRYRIPNFSKILDGARSSLVSLFALDTNFMNDLPNGKFERKDSASLWIRV